MTRPFIPTPDALEILSWLCGDDWGMSSRAILFAAMNASEALRPYHRYSHPLDPADLGRCYRMLDRFPWAALGIEALAKQSPHWASLRDCWQELKQMYDRELRDDGVYARETYARMRELGL